MANKPTTGRRRRLEQARLAQKRQRLVRVAVVVTGLVVVAVVGLVAFHSAGSGPTGVSDPARFDLPALRGSGRVRLASYRGRPVVVNMFASWCKVCTDELPGFTAVAREVGPRVQFIGLDSDETGDGEAMASQFGLQQAGFVLARDVGGSPASGLHDAVGAQGMPATLFYNADGQLVDKVLEGMSEATLRQKLAQLYGVS